MPVIQTSLSYDPYRQGFDTNEWRTLFGTPYLDANRLEITSGAISHNADILKGNITFNLQVPTDPSTMNAMIGLNQPSKGTFIGFVFAGTLYARVSDGTNSAVSSAITWDSAWNGVKKDFSISWESGIVKFLISGAVVATITSEYIPAGPLALYISDISPDPLSTGVIDVRGSQCIWMHLKTSDTAAPSEPAGSLVMVQSVTVTDVVSEMKIVTLFLPFNGGTPTNEAVTVTESVSMFLVNLSLPYVDGAMSESVTVTESITLTIV